MESLRGQAERFGAELVPEDVVSVRLQGEVKEVVTGDPQWGGQTVHRARSVILATGSAYRELGPAEREAALRSRRQLVRHCDGFFFRDQDIAVVGGGDSALEEATFLSRFARSVTVVHRRTTLRASKIMQARAMADPKITFRWNSEIVDVLGESKVSGVRLRDVLTGEESDLAVTGLFIAIGHDPRVDLFADQVSLDDEGYVAVHGRTGRTSVPGVFACGDVVDHEYRQAVTAAGSGCAAALDAERYLAALADEGDADRVGAAHSAAATAAAVTY
jgi:thioredoxin reductase (NADPH)